MSAMKAVELAGKQVSPEARKSLLAIRGVKSNLSQSPTEWYIWFYDNTAMQEGKRVRVAGGSVVEIKEGYTELDRMRMAAYKPDETIRQELFKVDSDEVLSRISHHPNLKGLKISSLSYDLRKAKGNVSPVWAVTIYIEKNATEKEFGTAKISAETGQIFDIPKP